jgi:predicted ATP-grasp superfamily ATP-dependent carboligase
MGIAIPGSAVATTFEVLAEAVALACPDPQDKWVIKSAYGFAARDRVLGRGPVIDHPQAKWARRRFERGESLLLQPWLKVEREYGVAMELKEDGSFKIIGISDLQTNGAGTGTGYLLGRQVDPERLRQLESMARTVAQQLFVAGYYGPLGVDALEHSGGLLPLLEINARYTMGFIALAVEEAWVPESPVFWSTK